VTIRSTAESIADMVRVEGGTFQMGAGLDVLSPPHERRVDAFYLDRQEVTVAEFRASGLVVPGLSGPERPPLEHPVTQVNWHAAVEFAERVGKRLMTEAEYEFAATNAGTTRFPWGDDPSRVQQWTYGPAGTPDFDVNQLGIRGLFSNAVEWTDSVRLPYPGGIPLPDAVRIENSRARAVRGGPQDADWKEGLPPPWRGGVRMREARDARLKSPTLGFRCARSTQPRFLPPSSNPVGT
jgi:formylglycine-generating enzyme required for sulfatase activity